jgi:hypothetical protein
LLKDKVWKIFLRLNGRLLRRKKICCFDGYRRLWEVAGGDMRGELEK